MNFELIAGGVVFLNIYMITVTHLIINFIFRG